MRPIEGIDVSGWQSKINWPAVVASGREFCYVKATEGIGHVSPGLASHLPGAFDSGLHCGLYHFARLDFGAHRHPLAQADAFVERGVRWAQERGCWLTLPPALDLEMGGIPRTLDHVLVTNWAEAWLHEVERLTGVRPVVYTGYWTWRRLRRTKALFPWRLWQADYGRPDPIPGWAPSIVQYTCDGTVPGYGGELDLNRCEDLAALLVEA